jgi:hypothetical protein
MPFTIKQFLDVMSQYNLAVWPLQIVFNLFAVVMLTAFLMKTKLSNKLISGGLAFFWLWIGIAYHLAFFTSINKAAYIFGALFIFQGVVFIYFGLVKQILVFELRKDWLGILGGLFVLYALIIYPILGLYFGHTFPRNPTFGLPCPTTIFTFGLLLFTIKRIPWYLIVIPFIWSLIGFSAAIQLTIYEDFGLGIAGVVGFVVILITNKNKTAVQ